MVTKSPEIRSIFSRNIKEQRKKLGFTLEKLAELTGLAVQTINDIEGCRRWVSDKTITKLSSALNVEVFQLFVPYNANKRELNSSPSSVLLELRQNIMSDAEKFCIHVDYRIKEALKSSLEPKREGEFLAQVPVRGRLERGR